MQDLATLRCKQNRQQEAAELLEEVAKRTPPHEATLRNLGTVYNMLRDHDKAGGLEERAHTWPRMKRVHGFSSRTWPF